MMHFGLRKISTCLDPRFANKAVPRSYYCYYNYYTQLQLWDFV